MYQCEAANVHGTILASANIDVVGECTAAASGATATRAWHRGHGETRGGFASRPAMGLYTKTDLASAHGLWPRSPARTVTSAPPIPVTLTWVGAGCFEWHMSFLT